MSTASSVPLIARREVRMRLRSKAFLAFTILIGVLIVGIGILHRVLSGDDAPSRDTVAVVGTPPPQLADAMASAGRTADVDITLTDLPDQAAAEAALDAGTVDAVIVTSNGSILFHREVDPNLQRVVNSAWGTASVAQSASGMGLTPQQTTELLSPPALQAQTVEPEDDDGIGTLVGFVTAVLILMSVTTFGGYVLSGVVEEKTSAIVELLLSHVRAYELLAGKVAGIGLVALVQMGVAVVAGVVALAISGADIPPEIWAAVPTTLLWFVGGFALYSTLFALAGSFVSRQEDAQAAAAPVSLTFMAAYFIVFTVGTDPESTTATVLSLLPAFSPLLMPLRIATGAAALWEIAVAVVLLVAAIVVVLRLAGAIYARTMLHRGSRITWRQALSFRTG